MSGYEERIALIDGDELVYKAGFASQHVYYHIYDGDNLVQEFKYKKEAVEWIGNDKHLDLRKHLKIEDEEIALANLRSAYNTIMHDVGALRSAIFLTGKDNFRFDIATITPYKERDPENKPVHYKLIKDYLIEEYWAKEVDGIEADDALSIAQWKEFEDKGGDWAKINTIICTQDKDLNMVPGPRYSPRTRELHNYSEEEAMKFFYCQLLTGDSTDSIPGIHGVGMAVAAKLYAKARCVHEEDYYQEAVRQYSLAMSDLKKSIKLQTQKTPEEVILEIGNLIWMQRHQGELWQPMKFFTKVMKLKS
jgi:hypothetical protein